MNLQVPAATVVALLLCSIRLTAWISIAPPFATAGIPRQVKGVVAVALSLPVVPLASHHVPSTDLAPLLGSAVEQIVIGGGLGFLTRLLFTAVDSAGSLIDTLGGFSAAYAYDPLSSNNNAVMGKFYTMMSTTLIFATGAHLIIIQGFMRTFTTIPLDGHIDVAHLGESLVNGTSSMFVSALQIAGPLIAVLFLSDVALGVLSRISPQLNIFQMSSAVKILITLGLVGLSFTLMPQVVTTIADDATRLVMGVAGGG